MRGRWSCHRFATRTWLLSLVAVTYLVGCGEPEFPFRENVYIDPGPHTECRLRHPLGIPNVDELAKRLLEACGEKADARLPGLWNQPDLAEVAELVDESTLELLHDFGRSIFILGCVNGVNAEASVSSDLASRIRAGEQICVCENGDLDGGCRRCGRRLSFTWWGYGVEQR